MVLGRKTYEGLAAVWPKLADDPTLGVFADQMNSMPKYVASGTLRGPLEWNATLLEGDLAQGVTAPRTSTTGPWSRSVPASWPMPSPAWAWSMSSGSG
jgi:hypothetical protein